MLDLRVEEQRKLLVPCLLRLKTQEVSPSKFISHC